LSEPASASAIHLKVDGLSVGWHGKAIVEDTSFDIDFATFNNRVPIVGRTGSGKTTMLYAMAAQARPLGGKIEWQLGDHGRFDISARGADHRVGATLRKEHFAFAFQDAALVPHLTVRENIRLPLELQKDKKTKRDLDAHVESVIQKVLTPQESVKLMAERFPDQLSGGQRQRMAFAQAMASDPMILFSDEPTGSLDSDTRMEVMRCINAWVDAEPHRCFLWITHHRDPFEFDNAPFALLLDRTDGHAQIRVIPTRDLHDGGSNRPAKTTRKDG
jgi:ABC-type lipoprotein export system ATPase subunit